tara:strand:+ start:2530 stop:2775 length:246 start_codon:yes stop_codon:yes gene_type:complete
MANKKSKKYKKSFYVKNGPSVNVTSSMEDFEWAIGAIAGKNGMLIPGEDIDEITYEVVDKDGNILDTQTATFSLSEDGGSE